MQNRYKFPRGAQRNLLLITERTSKLRLKELAKLFGIVEKSYRDWRREKFFITEKALEIIEKKFHIKILYSKRKALHLWKKAKSEASRKGGLARIKIYGELGTVEGRKKGGTKALMILKERGLIPKPKPFVKPKRYSRELAELVGILLGDGHIGKEQWSITLNATKDKDYSLYVEKIIKQLFYFQPSIFVRKKDNVIIIVGSGIKSIKYFQKLGLVIGNKVKQQVGVPIWIKNRQDFKHSCLMGLMDTDGGIFLHKYKVIGKEYRYKKLCFANRSIPLLEFVYDSLKELGFTPKKIMKVDNKRIWLYNENEVKRYLDIIGTHNTRLLHK